MLPKIDPGILGSVKHEINENGSLKHLRGLGIMI